MLRKNKYFFPISVAILFILTGIFVYVFNLYYISSVSKNHGAFWKGKIWLLEDGKEKRNENNSYKLISFSPDSQNRPTVEIEFHAPMKHRFGLVWLVADSDRLWIVSQYYVGYYKDKKIQFVKSKEILGDITDPFLFNNQLSVVERKGNALYLKSFDKGKWNKKQHISIRDMNIKKRMPLSSSLEIINVNEELFFLIRKNYKFYFYKGTPSKNQSQKQKWDYIPIEGVTTCSPVSLNDTLAVFYHDKSDLSSVKGKRLKDGVWKHYFTSEKKLYSEEIPAVYPINDSSDFVILRNSLIGPIHVTSVINGNEKPLFTMRGVSTIYYYLFIPLIPCFLMISCLILYRISR